MRRNGFTIMGKMIGLVKPLFHIMILAVLTGVVGYLFSIFITIMGGMAISSILGFNVGYTLKKLFIFIIIFAVFRGVLRYIEQLSNHYIAFKLLAIIRNKVFTALRKLCPAKLEGKEKGNLISIITSDIELLEVFYAHTISPIAIAIITSLIMVLFISSYNIYLGLISLLGYIIVGFVTPILASKLGKEEDLNYRNEFGDMNSFLLDSLRGLDEIIQYNLGSKRLEEIKEKTDNLAISQKKLKKYEAITKVITDISVFLFSSIILFMGIRLYRLNLINYNAVLISTIAMMSSFGPVLALSSLSGNLRHTLASGDRVLDLLEENPVVEDIRDGKDVVFDGASCKNIDFSYNKEEILQDFSLDIGKNKILGIYGKSGCGKSTLLKLLMRFWDVDKGSVNISKEDIRNINTKNLRDMESYVTQETYLFNDTIANNIAIGKKDASLEEIKLAAKKASIDEFIEKLPKGYNTELGELGDSLSSGERQRLGIARAFLHDSPLMLLDEPTSNLDSLNEAIILKSLKEESKNKTLVLVSHRESTMSIASDVKCMDNKRFS